MFLRKKNQPGKVVIIERAPSILGPLPAWMKEYVGENLKGLEIEVLTNSSIEKIEGTNVSVAGNRMFDDALVVWAAGVKTPACVQNLPLEKNPQGRIKVNEYLQAADRCFVTGDAAYFQDKGVFLRMAVQFALTQGACAAENIVSSLKGRALRPYKHVDLGYIIPMANNRSCGSVFGVDLRGLLPTVMHFLMCAFRSYGTRNRFGILGGLIRGGVK